MRRRRAASSLRNFPKPPFPFRARCCRVSAKWPRLSSTLLNAYLEPVLIAYIAHLTRGLDEVGIVTQQRYLMQSNGGVMPFSATIAGVVSALIAVGATLSIGIAGLSPLLVTIAAILAMGFGSATHNSLLGIVGGFYPTVVRGNGVGYAASMGRIAVIVGPATTGVLLTDYSLQVVLLSIAAPDLVVAAICIVLAYYAPRIGRAPGVDVRTPRRHRYSP